MESPEQFHELPVPTLAILRQCLADLALAPPVRHRLEDALRESEAQVRQWLEQAQRAVLLGRIAAHIVHDIRNPLNAIFLHADVVEEEMRQPTIDSRAQIRESITDIRAEVTRLYAVMQDYLALARLTVLERTPEELGPFLHDCAREIQPQAAACGISLSIQGLTRLGHVLLHKGTLCRAVQHLLQRGIDAMPQGGTLTLRGRHTSSHCTVEIRDTGRGIPEEQIACLFEPFTAAESEWSGLGLFVTREIIAAHHGTLDVQSTPGTGTTFTITLPLATTEAPQQP